MGTHPIFESDFDCLTDLISKNTRFIGKIREKNEFLMRQIGTEEISSLSKLVKLTVAEMILRQ